MAKRKTGADVPTAEATAPKIQGVYEIGGRVFRLSRPVPAVRLNFARFVQMNKGLFDDYNANVKKVASTPLPDAETVKKLGGVKNFRAMQYLKLLEQLVTVFEQSGTLEDLLAVGLLPDGETETTKSVAEIADYLKNNLEDKALEAVMFKDFFAVLWVQMGPIFAPVE